MSVTNKLIDIESPNLMDDGVVCARGRFVHVEPNASPRKTRSSSAPPHTGVCFNEVHHHGSSDHAVYDRYMSEWVGRAMRLYASRPITKHEEPGGKSSNREKAERVAPIVNKTIHSEKKVIGSPGLAEESDFVDASRTHWGLWSGNLAPDLPSTPDSEIKLEDPRPCKLLALGNRRPHMDPNIRWIEENVLSKHPHHETPAATKEVTTLQICDIPCSQGIAEMIDAIHSLGFANTFNFVYMPWKGSHSDTDSIRNMGYAFVNFETAEDALLFGHAFKNYRFPSGSAEKSSYTVPASCQGYTENMERFVKKNRQRACLAVFL